MIYYKFTATGVELDSVITISRNKEEYGKFNGFKYNGKIGYPTNQEYEIDTTEKNVIRE